MGGDEPIERTTPTDFTNSDYFIGDTKRREKKMGIHKEKDVIYNEEKKEVGIKYDKEKLRYDLLSPEALEGIVEVLTYGANKYSDDNWKNVSAKRYEAAAFRHIQAYRKGEKIDKESGLGHLYHAISCLIFIAELESS